MKRQKRDLTQRAFKKGYQAGVTGKSRDDCPSDQMDLRQQWMSGWREGRNDSWDGYTGVSGIHKTAQMGVQS